MTRSQLPVLVVDDQPAVVKALQVLFDLNQIPHRSAVSPEEAERVVAGETLGTVVQDMNFGGEQTTGEAGIELFHRIRNLQPGLPILLMTAWASLQTAVSLVKEGAADYIEKPWDDERLVATVRNLVRMRTLELENQRLKSELQASRESLASEFDLCGIVYASEPMHRVVSLAASVAGSDAPVLITGPNGSGKERLADIVQANSRRREKPFVRVNVGAIPEELMESELFGAEPGAYTGLQGRRLGHFETADGGTLFLDEIDALSLAGQVKLLRVLQSGEFQRLGSSQTRRADVRVLSATNSDLATAIENGRFREDLYFRLNVVELEVPSLKQRADDVLPLAEYFLDRFQESSTDGSRLTLSDEARRELVLHDWSGNVRELENRIQRATVVSDSGEISAIHLGLAEADLSASSPELRAFTEDQARERSEILHAISHANGVVARAAEELGISRQALYRKMARLGIELERRAKG